MTPASITIWILLLAMPAQDGTDTNLDFHFSVTPTLERCAYERARLNQFRRYRSARVIIDCESYEMPAPGEGA